MVRAAAVARTFGAFGLGAALVLSGCTVQPLYAPAADGASVQADLAAIQVLPATDRLTQVARNELLFAFTGGSPAEVEPLYQLSLRASQGGGGLSVTAPGNEATTGISVTLRFTLIDSATRDVIASGTTRAETRYVRSNSAFANMRAEEDAAERAAIEAARQAALDIAAILAARP